MKKEKDKEKKKKKNKKGCWNRVIALANQKGGVGKSTTAINLSACLAEAGKKVLTIDMDPQGNTTSGLGVEKNEVENTIYELLLGDCEIEDAIIPLARENHHLISSNVNLAAAELELLDMKDKEFLVRKQLKKVRDNYDFVIIDCPPSLNMLTINALTAADTVLVPLQCEYYALEGLAQLMYTVELIQDRLNDTLKFEGVVFTMFDGRTNLANQVMENVKENLDQYMYNSVINRNVRLAEAPSYGMPIIDYDSRSTGAENYRSLAAEVISREEI
ncbi:MAG: AAA family ATPase [Lachnospiraceae bacterium]|nr:AAA family ATPase [Lachnospiraceae bacterium]